VTKWIIIFLVLSTFALAPIQLNKIYKRSGDSILERDNNFDIAFEMLISAEGTYSNVMGDRGGRTIYGITKRDYPIIFRQVYDLYKTGRPKLAKHQAKIFYEGEFWNPLYDKISNKLAYKIFDLSVNRGKRTAVKSLQRVLKYGLLYDLKVTGQFTHREVDIIINHLPQDEIYDQYIQYNYRSYRRMASAILFIKGWTKRLFRNYTEMK